MKKILLCPVRVETISVVVIYFQGQENGRDSLSLSGSLFFGNFPHCDLGIKTCYLLDDNLKLMLTIEKKTLN